MWSPWKTHWALSLVKGNQGTTQGKRKNYFDLGGNRTHDLRLDLPLLQSNGRSNPKVVGSIPTEVKIIFFFTLCGSLIPFTRDNAQWVFHGLHIALKFTLQSQLILCYTICVHSATSILKSDDKEFFG